MQSTSSQAATMNPSPPVPDSKMEDSLLFTCGDNLSQSSINPGKKIRSEKEDAIPPMCVLNPPGEPSFNELLINTVQDYPMLYNNQRRAHDNIDRSQVWAEVAARIGRGASAQFTKKRWLQLRDRYRKELKHSIAHNYTQPQKWNHFHLLSWLDPYLQGAVQYTNNGDSSTLYTLEGVNSRNDFGDLTASLNQTQYDGSLSETGLSDSYLDVKPEMSTLQSILAAAEATAKLKNFRDADENEDSCSTSPEGTADVLDSVALSINNTDGGDVGALVDDHEQEAMNMLTRCAETAGEMANGGETMLDDENQEQQQETMCFTSKMFTSSGSQNENASIGSNSSSRKSKISIVNGQQHQRPLNTFRATPYRIPPLNVAGFRTRVRRQASQNNHHQLPSATVLSEPTGANDWFDDEEMLFARIVGLRMKRMGLAHRKLIRMKILEILDSCDVDESINGAQNESFQIS